MPTPLFAAGLSAVIPGLGQLYNGQHAKGIAILCSTFGIWGGLLWSTVGPDASRSWLSAVALVLAYPFLLLPAVLDAHRRARGIPEISSSEEKRWRVVIMLLLIGPFAIPQLWLSSGFSRNAKVLWTLLVVLIALVVILVMVATGPALEHWLEEVSAPLHYSGESPGSRSSAKEALCDADPRLASATCIKLMPRRRGSLSETSSASCLAVCLPARSILRQ